MLGVNSSTPLLLQDPPRGFEASQRGTGAPPTTSITLSFPAEKNAILRLSGDQNGKVPFSVPSSACASPDLRERIQMWSPAPKTRLRPSGERTGGAPTSPINWNGASSGGGMEATRRVPAGGFFQRAIARAISANTATTAAIASNERSLDPREMLLTDPALVLSAAPELAIHSSSAPMSLALCQRLAKSLTRAREITCSSAGDICWRTVEIGSGSFSRIAEARLICDLPSIARLPVNIS